MTRRIKIFDDEIVARKVFTKIGNASKLPLNYINKNIQASLLVKICLEKIQKLL